MLLHILSYQCFLKERMINTFLIHFTDISKFGLIEFQIETGLGIICSVLGLLTTAMYYRTEGNRRYVGLSACVSCLLTGKKNLTLKPYHKMIDRMLC